MTLEHFRGRRLLLTASFSSRASASTLFFQVGSRRTATASDLWRNAAL